MPKCAFESRSSQRKKATAKADALRAVIVKTKPPIQSLVYLQGSRAGVSNIRPAG